MYKVGFLCHMSLSRLFLIFFLFSETNVLFGINISTNFNCFFDLINKIFYSFKKNILFKFLIYFQNLCSINFSTNYSLYLKIF